jgi:hypothetical protein
MEEMGWTGLLIEANFENFQKLTHNRPKSPKVFGAAYDKDGEIEFIKNTGYTNMLSGVKETCHKEHRERMEIEQKTFGGSTEVLLHFHYSSPP